MILVQSWQELYGTRKALSPSLNFEIRCFVVFASKKYKFKSIDYSGN